MDVVLVWVAFACSLWHGDCVAISIHKPVEVHTTGSFSALPANNVSDRIAVEPMTWPLTAVSKGEIILERLHGGTHPQKVKVGSSVYVRKKTLVGAPQAIMMEALVNNLYHAAHVNCVNCRYYSGTDTIRAYMLCHWVDGLKPIFEFTDGVKNAVSEHYVLDAVLGNFDVGGMTGDYRHLRPRGNIGWDENKQLVRIDNGGSLAADGSGQWKETSYNCKDHVRSRRTVWSPEPFSIWDFWHTSDVYRHLSRSDLEKQAQSVVAMHSAFIRAIHDFNVTEATQKAQATLNARIGCLDRILKSRLDLFDERHFQAPRFDLELPSEICDGVRSVCADLMQTVRVPKGP